MNPAADGSDDPSVEAFLKQAEIARQRQAWEDVIRIFQVALKQSPDDRRLRHGLAQAYGAKADQVGFRPLHHRAMEEYWRLVNSDASDARAHDGLLTAAVKADQLDVVMEEYRSRMNRNPESVVYRDTFKKIQTLYFLKAEPAKPESAENSSRFAQIALARVAPLAALGCLVGWFIVRGKVGADVQSATQAQRILLAAFSRLGIFFFLGSLAYQLFRYLRARA